jgi:hypothetical protein
MIFLYFVVFEHFCLIFYLKIKFKVTALTKTSTGKVLRKFYKIPVLDM